MGYSFREHKIYNIKARNIIGTFKASLADMRNCILLKVPYLRYNAYIAFCETLKRVK